jgi:tRNA dimethylallyltransferase
MKIYKKDEILEKIYAFLNTKSDQEKVLEILGPTASGKTNFALWLAKKINPAEIISVDSRQIYRKVDIASAKISNDEMQGIPHWGLGIRNPDEEFSVYDFQQYGFSKIKEILDKKSLPILCGGTMLWLDSISENYIFSSDLSIKSNTKGNSLYKFLKIGIHWERKILYERINKRSQWLFENGLIEETQNLLTHYNLSHSALSSFGYQEIRDYLDEKLSYDEALLLNQKRNRNYAKRQLTWWRGRNDVIWLDGKTL